MPTGRTLVIIRPAGKASRLTGRVSSNVSCMNACALAVRTITTLTSWGLLLLALVYVLKSSCLVWSAGITATGSLRETVLAATVAFLYVGAAIVLRRTGVHLSVGALACSVRLAKATVYSVLWLCAGVLLLIPQLVVY